MHSATSSYLRTNAGWQVIVVPRATVIWDASAQPAAIPRMIADWAFVTLLM
jgi:hypothetical protein